MVEKLIKVVMNINRPQTTVLRLLGSECKLTAGLSEIAENLKSPKDWAHDVEDKSIYSGRFTMELLAKVGIYKSSPVVSIRKYICTKRFLKKKDY
jgi:hypothetical protein